VTAVLRELPLPPDVDALARALRGADAPGLAVLRADPRGALGGADARFSFVAGDPVERSDAWIPPLGTASPGWAGFPAAPRWIGMIPYEAGRGLERPSWTRAPETRAEPPIARPAWHRYDAVARVDHVSGRVVVEADDAAAADRLARALRSRGRAARTPELRRIDPREPATAHVERVREVLRLIARGDVYQVNLARELAYDFHGDPLDAFTTLFDASPAPYGFFADLGGVAVCAASPELALEVRGDTLRTAPIKGTRPRGVDAPSDASLARELAADPKELAELTMAIDLHRNDLGHVARIGSVRVLGPPRVLAGRTVWSRVAEIAAQRAPGVDLETIARAVLPCGSVTGAPKVRAMEIIASLEPFRRGLYTGAFGYVGRDGGLVLAVAIRTLEILGGRTARYCTGGGIVADSDPERELLETRWKAAQLASMEAAGNLAKS
jgi:anthranilate/para-aminobenzoate synthase component I